MARPPVKELTPRELQIMKLFWEHGEMTAHDARQKLAADGPDLAYTTVATLVRILVEKECLRQTTTERPFRFIPARTFEEVSRRMLGDLVESVFSGSRELLLKRLFEQKRLTTKERAMLEAMLKQP